MRSPLPKTVRTRTTLAATAVVAVALALASITLLHLLRSHLVDAQRDVAQLRADDVAELASGQAVSRELSIPGGEDGVTEIVSGDGNLLASTDDAATRSLDPTPQIAVLSGPGDIRAADQLGTSRFIIATATASTPNGPVKVYTAASLERADSIWNSMRGALLVTSVLLCAGVALLTRRVVGQALSPVEAIRAEVDHISHGDLNKRVPEPGTGDEIDRLAASMNTMLNRLELSSDRQRRFVGDASHELKSPLASIRTVLEVALFSGTTVDLLRESIEDALVDSGRLEALVGDLLVLARLDDPAGLVALAPVDLGQEARTLIAQRGDGSLELVEPAELDGSTTVTGDRGQLQRVLANLLDNAARHRRSTSRITVRSDGSDVVVQVEDDGRGIPERDRERIFERFVRIDAARTSGNGTGLGLAIVSDTIAAHGGTVLAESSDLGGARFVVRIPQASVSAAD
jgi:signal transduction histidine kinase